MIFLTACTSEKLSANNTDNHDQSAIINYELPIELIGIRPLFSNNMNNKIINNKIVLVVYRCSCCLIMRPRQGEALHADASLTIIL